MPTRILDAVDRRILRILQSEGRISVSDLADRIGISATPCLRRLRALEENGYISHYSAVLDQNHLGLPVSVFLQVKIANQAEQALSQFENAVSKWPEVVECYLMTGPRDYLLRVVCPDVAGYEKFLKEKMTRLTGIASMESSFALRQIKYTNALPV